MILNETTNLIINHINSVRPYINLDGLLHEERTLTIYYPRQFGTTTAIASMFDMKKDIYITVNNNLCIEFFRRISEVQDSSDKILYNSMKSSVDSLRGREIAIGETITIWYDAMDWCSKSAINKKIEDIDKLLDFQNTKRFHIVM